MGARLCVEPTTCAWCEGLGMGKRSNVVECLCVVVHCAPVEGRTDWLAGWLARWPGTPGKNDRRP